MIYHVLPGDSVAGDFKKLATGADAIVCRECLVVGDADADSLEEFWEQRARFILAEYGEDEIEYHERVADELARILDIPEGSKVYLWFEYELFCSVNMWFCLWLLSLGDDVTVYRVEPWLRSEDDRWKGFGGLNTMELRECLDAAGEIDSADRELGVSLWNAYRKRDFAKLLALSEIGSGRFPYLEEVCRAAIKIDTRPLEIIDEIRNEGFTDFVDIFAEFSKRAGVYGFGDLQVERLLAHAAN